MSEQPNELRSISQSTRDGRCLEVWFARNVTDEDRAILSGTIVSHASLKADNEQLRKAIDVLESNDRVQARLLADTGRRVVALEQVISEEMYPENCDDDANRMLLESAIESHKQRIRASAALSPSTPEVTG